jgi:hypothetical protein
MVKSLTDRLKSVPFQYDAESDQHRVNMKFSSLKSDVNVSLCFG